MADLFKEIIPSIMEKNVQAEFEDKEYPAFVVNKALSFHYDTLPYAWIMDQNSHLDSRMQYDFLFHVVRKHRRKFVPWSKATKDGDIELIRRHYGYSYRKAIAAAQILTEAQIDELRELYKNAE